MSGTPWKNGFYYSDKNTPQLYKLDGEKLQIFYTVYLDHPDIEPIADGTWTFGNFGPARTEIQKASGFENYNLKTYALDGLVQK